MKKKGRVKLFADFCMMRINCSLFVPRSFFPCSDLAMNLIDDDDDEEELIA